MRRHYRRLATLVLVVAALATTGATADVVTDWNEVALDAIRATSTNPPRATRALAIMHTAIFDAVNGIEREFEPYAVTRRGPRRASAEAAAVEAAFATLVELFPSQESGLRRARRDSMSALRLDRGRWLGRAYGRLCAKRILSMRAADGSDDVVFYEPSGEFGDWRPTPPGFAPALLPHWPLVTPFCMEHGAQFRVPPPPPFDSAAYAESYDEVRELGGVDSPARTADQTQIAYFWEDGPHTATPPGHWQVVARQMAELFDNDLLDNARLFALLSMVQADGAIVAWDNKYAHDHVRPYTAITEEAGDDGNAETDPDPTWFNLIPTPPFPTYTSGHSTFSGGSARLLERFFGTDEVSFCAPSPDPERWPEQLTGVVRCWTSLSQAAEEAGQSRVYGGIHWQYDNQEGLNSGRALADYVYASVLLPLDGDSDDDSSNDDSSDDDSRERRSQRHSRGRR